MKGGTTAPFETKKLGDPSSLGSPAADRTMKSPPPHLIQVPS